VVIIQPPPHPSNKRKGCKYALDWVLYLNLWKGLVGVRIAERVVNKKRKEKKRCMDQSGFPCLNRVKKKIEFEELNFGARKLQNEAQSIRLQLGPAVTCFSLIREIYIISIHLFYFMLKASL
jgi:hypothetical protein